MIDLWGDETEIAAESEAVDVDDVFDVKLWISNGSLMCKSRDLLPDVDRDAIGVTHFLHDDVYVYQCDLRPINAYVVRYAVREFCVDVDPETLKVLKDLSGRVPEACASLTSQGIELTLPAVEPYQDIARALDARRTKKGTYMVPRKKALNVVDLLSRTGPYPYVRVSRSIFKIATKPLPGFNGTLEGLKAISVEELDCVKASRFQSFGLRNLYDLVTFFPYRYVDKSNPQPLSSYTVGEVVTAIGTVKSSSFLPRNMGVRFVIDTEFGDSVPVVFWRQNWLRNKFPRGSRVAVNGKLSFYQGRVSVNGRSIESVAETLNVPVVPIYSQSATKNVTSKDILAAERELFSRLGPIEPPKYFRSTFSYDEALKQIHVPDSMEALDNARRMLAEHELIYSQLLMSKKRAGVSMRSSDTHLAKRGLDGLPFRLTRAQAKAVKALFESLAKPDATTILLNADVGAGKTVVMQLACLRAVEAGYRAVCMAPTEVLARQLFTSTKKMAEPLGVSVGWNTDTCDITVGTTAVLNVDQSRVGVVVIDEQQKFGTAQRDALSGYADVIMASATPIPRSMAQAMYGDIDIVTLDELPPGRRTVDTVWVRENPNDFLSMMFSDVLTDIENEAKAGHQTFVVTPLVEDSVKVDAASVEGTLDQMRTLLPNLTVEGVHGKMKKADQVKTLDAFRAGDIDMLVSSTVVEVGVDVPGATRVVVLSADRLGASSLHQIRGRVGRNSFPSRCYMVSDSQDENARARLQSLVDHSGGFDVARADLELRGSGHVFGMTQHGRSDFMFATLDSDISRAHVLAQRIVDSEYRDEAILDAQRYFGRDS